MPFFLGAIFVVGLLNQLDVTEKPPLRFARCVGLSSFSHVPNCFCQRGNARSHDVCCGSFADMSKGFLVLLLPLALAGCEVGHVTLPMTLGSDHTPKASCLTYADAPAFGDCKRPGDVSISRETK